MRKKPYVFLLICVIMIFLTACKSSSIEPLNGVVNENIGGENTPHDPPRVLSFASFEEIGELKNISNQHEDVILKYLNSHNFTMNGLTSEEDVITLFDHISDLEMLHLENSSAYRVTNISYYVDYGYIMTTYRNDKNMVRFICYIEKDGGSVVNSAHIDKENATITRAGELTVADTLVPLYETNLPDSPFGLTGVLDTPNSQITILLSSHKDSDAKKIEENLVQVTLDELIGE